MRSESQIDAALSSLFSGLTFPAEPAGLYDQLRYMINIGGKMLRPKLYLTVYSLFKDELDERVLQPAAALEIFHCSTLIHDDIIDASPLRRGVPSVWTKWGRDEAILAGDAMLIDAFRRMAKAPETIMSRAMDLFTTTAAQVQEGQQLDLQYKDIPEVSVEDYLGMIGHKTGVLLGCCAKMGALIAGMDEDVSDNLYEYGYNLGLAFQITDDYLDAYGDEDVFGKPIGGDIVNNMKSWLTIHALQVATPSQKASILEAMDMPVDTEEERGEKIACFRNIYTTLEVDEDAKYEILRLSNKALSFASKACRGVRYETLRRFSEKLIGRSR